jgi:Flp pilus assembly pilin Flp
MLEVALWNPAFVKKCLRREDGQALVEYALILGLVSVIAIALLSATGASVTSLLQAVTSALNSAL